MLSLAISTISYPNLPLKFRWHFVMEMVRTFRLSLIDLKIFFKLAWVILVSSKYRCTMVELLVNRKHNCSTTLWLTVGLLLKFRDSSLISCLANSSMNKLISLRRRPVFDRSKERKFLEDLMYLMIAGFIYCWIWKPASDISLFVLFIRWRLSTWGAI